MPRFRKDRFVSAEAWKEQNSAAGRPEVLEEVIQCQPEQNLLAEPVKHVGPATSKVFKKDLESLGVFLKT